LAKLHHNIKHCDATLEHMQQMFVISFLSTHIFLSRVLCISILLCVCALHPIRALLNLTDSESVSRSPVSLCDHSMTGFQLNLGGLSAEIKQLQTETLTLNVKLANRRELESTLVQFTDRYNSDVDCTLFCQARLCFFGSAVFSYLFSYIFRDICLHLVYPLPCYTLRCVISMLYFRCIVSCAKPLETNGARQSERVLRAHRRHQLAARRRPLYHAPAHARTQARISRLVPGLCGGARGIRYSARVGETEFKNMDQTAAAS
jgi:hypothetical protein